MKDYGFRHTKLTSSLERYISLVALLFFLELSFTAHAEEQNSHEVVSRYLNDMNNYDYSEVEAPKKAPIFRWDFSKKKVQAYSYKQDVITETQMDSAPGNDLNGPEQSMFTKGALLIKSQGDGTAELVLNDIKSSIQITINKTDAPKTVEQEMPPFVVQGMKEDGTGSFGDSSQDMLLKLIFPLPTKSLKVGEYVDVPAQIPFNAMGSQLQVKGRSRITLTRYVLIGDRTCAQINVDTNISDLKIPTELVGKYSCSAKGSAVFFFDINSRSFVSGSTAFLMQFSVDAPTPKMNVQGETSQDLPERMKMAMKSDNFIRISLQE